MERARDLPVLCAGDIVSAMERREDESGEG